MLALSSRAEEWRARGRMVVAGGREIFVLEDGEGPAVFILHGFPGSSFDWREVVPELVHRGLRAVTFDFLGHGYSEKPKDAPYSLFEQADVAEAVAKVAGIERCTLVSHDMGDSVAAELLMRSAEGRLGFAINRSILTNGSIFIDLAQLSPGQLALLAMPDEALADPLPLDVFKPGLAATFATQNSPADELLDDMLDLIRFNDGDRVLPRVIRYIEERRANQRRWTDALVGYAGPMTAMWGAQDPIAVVDMAHRLLDLRPSTEVVLWDDCGHWPSIEQPLRLATAVADRALQ